MKRYRLTKKDRELLAFALTVKGPQQQLAKASEELQELGQVLTKILGDTLVAIKPAAHPWEAIINHPAAAKVHAELADVELLLHQVRRIFGPAPERCYRKKLDGLATELGQLQLDKLQAENRMHRKGQPGGVRIFTMGADGGIVDDYLLGIVKTKAQTHQDSLDAMRYATSLVDPVLGPKAANAWTDAIKDYYREKELHSMRPSYMEDLLAQHSASYLDEFKRKHGGKDREPLGSKEQGVKDAMGRINQQFIEILLNAKTQRPQYVPVPAHRLRPGDVVKIKKGLVFTAKLDKVDPAYDCIHGRIMRLHYTMQEGVPATGSIIKPRHHTVEVLAFKDHAEPDQLLQDQDTESTDMLVPAKRLQVGDVVQLPTVPTPVTLTFVEVRAVEVGLYHQGGQYWAAPLRKIHVMQLHDQPMPPATIMIPAERLQPGQQIVLHGEVETVDSCTVQPPEEEPLGEAVTKLREEVHVSFTSGHSIVYWVGDSVDLVAETVQAIITPAAPGYLQAGMVIKHPTTGGSILVTKSATRNGQNFTIPHLTLADRFDTVEVGGDAQLQVLHTEIGMVHAPVNTLTPGNIIRHPHTGEVVMVTDNRLAGKGGAAIVSHRAAGMAICAEDRTLRMDPTATVQRITGWYRTPF